MRSNQVSKQSIGNMLVAPRWQFRLQGLLREHKITYLLTCLLSKHCQWNILYVAANTYLIGHCSSVYIPCDALSLRRVFSLIWTTFYQRPTWGKGSSCPLPSCSRNSIIGFALVRWKCEHAVVWVETEADSGMFSMFGRTGAPQKGGPTKAQKCFFFHFFATW